MEERLIAPCGINCHICPQYQKKKNPCVGCRTRTTRKSQICILKNCQKECRGKSESCADCTEFPCKRLLALNQRYQTKTGGLVCPIENLQTIRQDGITVFYGEKKKNGPVLCVGILCLSLVYTLTVQPVATPLLPNKTAELYRGCRCP